MIPWKRLAEAYSHATRIDVAAYREEFNGIDEAAARAERWEPGPMEDVVRIRARDSATNDVVEICGIRPPVIPVRVTDSARLVVALLQREAWLRAALWAGAIGAPSLHRGASLPSYEKLLRRKLVLRRH